MSKKVKTRSALVQWIGQDLPVESVVSEVAAASVVVKVQDSGKREKRSQSPQKNKNVQRKNLK